METAITIPILFLLVALFFVVGQDVEAHIELQTAVRLATISAATAPITADDAVARSFASMSFNASKENFALIKDTAGPLACQFTHPQMDGAGNVVQPGLVSCSDTAHLTVLQPADDRITASAIAHVSPYRGLQ